MTLAVILIFPNLGFGENEAVFCKQFSGMTKTQINDKFLGRRGQFGYDDFYALLDRIGKGDKDCFRVGVVLANNSRQYGHMALDIFEAFAALAENKPGLFAKYKRQYPMSTDLLLDIFRIPDWKLDRFRKKEVLLNITRRKAYLSKYGPDSLLDELGYKGIIENIEYLSRTHIEKYYDNGTRIVYTSNIPYLVSDKPYSLANMLDNNKNTAWCIDYKKAGKLPIIRADFDVNDLKCNKPIDDKCHIEGIRLSIRSGYQKSSSTYMNNARIKSFVLETNYTDKNSTRIEKLFGLTDEAEEKHVTLAVNRDVSMVPDIHVRVVDVYKGKKYPELCVSELYFEVVQ